MELDRPGYWRLEILSQTLEQIEEIRSADLMAVSLVLLEPALHRGPKQQELAALRLSISDDAGQPKVSAFDAVIVPLRAN